MSGYKYTRDELTLAIKEADSGRGHAAVGIEYRDGPSKLTIPSSPPPHRFVILVEPRERQTAAQALAGSAFKVVDADDQLDWTIDPADVKVGDVVEVEANDGSWLVRGERLGGDSAQFNHDYGFSVQLGPRKSDALWIYTAAGATVRLVRRAEPDPDPEQIKALTERIGKANLAAGPAPTGGDYADWWESMARELARCGVTVGGAS